MRLRPKKGQKKGQMAKELVYFCLRVLVWTLLWAAGLYTVAVIWNKSIDLSPVLTFVGAAFGGELLMLLMKRVLAKKNENTEDSTYDV